MKALKIFVGFVIVTSLIGNIVLAVALNSMKRKVENFFGIDKATTTQSSEEDKTTTTADTATTTSTTKTSGSNGQKAEETEVKEADTVQTDDEEKEKEEIVQQYTVEDPEASDLGVYLGLGPANWEEIPTWDSWAKSQEKSWYSDYMGTEHGWNNDARRIFLKAEVASITAEYEADGKIKEKKISFEEIDEGLWRVDPYFRLSNVDGKWEHKYVTYKFTTVDEKEYFMTWVPLMEDE